MKLSGKFFQSTYALKTLKINSLKMNKFKDEFM